MNRCVIQILQKTIKEFFMLIIHILITVFIWLNTTLDQTWQMEAKLPINAALKSNGLEECGVYTRIIRKTSVIYTIQTNYDSTGISAK